MKLSTVVKKAVLNNKDMALLKANFEYWIANFMAKENIYEYSFDLVGNTQGGEGYCGDISYINIKAMKDDNEVFFNIVMKSVLNNMDFRKIMPVVHIYDRGIRFYKDIMPDLLNTLKENLVQGNATVMFKLPQCFYFCQEEFKECLMLDNMKFQGFEVHDRKKCMNLDHVLLVVKNYAHFHGMSYVYKQYHPEKFKNYAENIENMWGLHFTALKIIKTVQSDIQKLLSYLTNQGFGDVAEKYKGLDKEIEEIVVHLQAPNDPSLVLTHGDCWNNNLMFKYANEDKKKVQPIDLCILDFQHYRMASPAFELSHFIYCCTDQQVLKDFDLILETYHVTLHDFLKQFNCNIENFLSFDELKRQFGVYGKYGVCFAFIMMKFNMCDAGEAPNLENLLAKDGSLKNFIEIEYNDNKKLEYSYERLKDVCIHYAENFL